MSSYILNNTQGGICSCLHFEKVMTTIGVLCAFVDDFVATHFGSLVIMVYIKLHCKYLWSAHTVSQWYEYNVYHCYKSIWSQWLFQYCDNILNILISMLITPSSYHGMLCVLLIVSIHCIHIAVYRRKHLFAMCGVGGTWHCYLFHLTMAMVVITCSCV